MLGEFHRYNNSPGLRNPEFFPLRTPYPSLAMRYMVPSDLPFLSPDKYPPRLRVAFLESFLSRFGPEGGPEVGSDGSAGGGKPKRKAREAKEIAGAREALVAARAAVEEEEAAAAREAAQGKQGGGRPRASSQRSRSRSRSRFGAGRLGERG